MQRFRSEIHIRKQRISHLSGQFRWNAVIAYLENEKTKLANKFLTKLKKAARRVNRSIFVLCFVPSDNRDMKAKMLSGVMDDSAMSLK